MLRTRTLRTLAAGTLLALLTTACNDAGDPPESAGGNGLEKTQLTVGMMPIVDVAPFFIAKERGFFKDEGLTIEYETIQGGADGIPKLQSGALDISWGNYVSSYLAHAKGIKMNLVTEGYNAEENTLLVMAMPDAGIRKPEDLEGKTVAVNTLGNVGTMTVKSVLETHDVDPKTVEFVELPFPDMAAALERGSVDAAWMVEPFITQVKAELGAREVLDSASGTTAGFPIAAYFCTQRFQQENPNTVAAFRRAYQRAQEVAQDRSVVEEIVPTYTKISAETAAIMTVAQFPTTIKKMRLQRVADLMYESGLLDRKLDVRTLLSGQ